MTTAHVSPFAGSWYPGRRAELESLLDSMFDSSLRRTGEDLVPRPLAFVVPHAGLAYSGTVAAAAYRNLRAAQPRRVFILGFAHSGGRPGVSIPDTGAFQTPLGVVEVDPSAVRELARSEPFLMTPESRVCDHSVEIQLPLLQRASPGTPVVPLYVCGLDQSKRRAAARALAQIVRPGDVLLASSDLTHYGRAFGYQPFPVDEDTPGRLRELDGQAISAAGSLDPELFLESLQQTGATVCGSDPIALLLETLGLLGGEDIFQQTLDYQTSAEIAGSYEHSVSYGALGYFRADSFELSPEDRQALLESVAATLRHLRETGQRNPVPPPASAGSLQRRSGVFVSLHKQGELLGCIGNLTTPLPLAEETPRMALAAALDDPRFWPHSRLPEGIDVEISVLSPMKRIRDWTAFRLGRDGAFLECGAARGLLLPQVAHGGAWTPDQFLDALSRKAGLRPGAYREADARLAVFRAQVFATPV
ncbi:MAG: AmmeMemoRadiSam system protein B [Bryobacteraceae bacterium]